MGFQRLLVWTASLKLGPVNPGALFRKPKNGNAPLTRRGASE